MVFSYILLLHSVPWLVYLLLMTGAAASHMHSWLRLTVARAAAVAPSNTTSSAHCLPPKWVELDAIARQLERACCITAHAQQTGKQTERIFKCAVLLLRSYRSGYLLEPKEDSFYPLKQWKAWREDSTETRWPGFLKLQATVLLSGPKTSHSCSRSVLATGQCSVLFLTARDSSGEPSLQKRH